MSRALIAAFAIVVASLVMAPASDAARTCSASEAGNLGVKIVCIDQPSVAPGAPPAVEAPIGEQPTYITSPMCSTGFADAADACRDTATCDGGEGVWNSVTIVYPDGTTADGGRVCSTDQVSGSAPVLTPGDVLSAFRRMELPESQIVVQPPGGETLVNFDTIFSTEASTESQTFTLLGLQVEIEAEPSEFEWAHGDGTVQSTDWPGREFAEGVAMERFISHRYVDAHVTVEPSVDTVWSARFRVNGGAWQPVVGTVEIAGDPSSLRVVEGQPNLVG